MLRHALPSTSRMTTGGRRLGVLVNTATTTTTTNATTLRRGLAAAATSAEKRALNHNQLKGVGGTTTSSTTTKTSTPASPPNQGGGGGGGGSSSLPLILGGVALVGGAGIAYSQGMIPGVSPHVEQVVAIKDTAKVEPLKKEVPSPKTTISTTKPAQTADAKGEAAEAPIGNRVMTISLPVGSRRSTPPTTTTTEHPVGGNRVAMSPKTATPETTNGPSPEPSVDAALQELKGQLSQESSITLQEARQELAKLSSLDIKELDTMTPTQLKIRLIQLSKDLEERTKWEAVRLKEFLAMKEQEVQNK
jgi:hypothetical protein